LDNITIAIDAMGGDHGLKTVIPAAVMSIKEHKSLKLILVGDSKAIARFLLKYKIVNHDRISIVHASEVVDMDELPSHALRNKKDSSMRVAINLVKSNDAIACVSAGNTGALMAIARFVLKTLPGIDRPAIIAALPTYSGKVTRIIDLGANIDSCAEHLFQFAVIGSSLIQAIDHVKSPKIGLLNIGVEEMKGNDQVKRTAHLLAESDLLNYVGYVEGNHFYSGDVDLIVCDGFVGNVALKVSEGLAHFMISVLREVFHKNFITKIIGILAKPVLKEMRKRMDPDRYNGASLLGLNGIVIKSHGGASARAFKYAIDEAIAQAQNNVVNLVREKIDEFMHQGLLT
jgi:phosphate acyltransferase